MRSHALSIAASLFHVYARGMLLVLTLCGCGARPLLPTLSVHAVLTLRQNARDMDARQAGSNDFGVQAQLAFRPRGTTRVRDEQALIPISLPRQPDCQYTLACEWAQLAEESALNALGVAP